MLLCMVSCSRRPVRHEIIEPSYIQADEITTTKNIPQTHREFLARFLPEIHKANNSILKQRNKVLDLLDTLEIKDRLSGPNMEELNRLLQYYRLEPLPSDPQPASEQIAASIHKLLKRADIIPVKLVMAQAIIESGWGSSEFAKEGNNYFGVHCYTEGCGVKPSGVDSAKFYVKAYPTEMAGIKDYLWILNTGYAYKELRNIRQELRKKGKAIDALSLARGLESYSIKGEAYVDLVSNIIRNYLPHDTKSLLLGKS